MYLLPTAELEKQDVSLFILCLLPGGQRWRKHRQLSLLSAPLHDPLAQRSHVQRHDCRPQEVRLQKAKFANMKTKRANVAPHDILLSPRVSSAGSRQICTTWLQGRTLLSWPSKERSRQTSTRLKSFLRRHSVLQSNSTRGFFITEYQIIPPTTHILVWLDLFHFSSIAERTGNSLVQ